MCDLKLRTTSYSYSVINKKEKYFRWLILQRDIQEILKKKIMELMFGSKHLNSKRFEANMLEKTGLF